MGILNEKIIQAAWDENKNLGGIVVTLNNFEVIGTLYEKDAVMLCDFLERNEVDYEYNGKFLVWLTSLSSILKDLFKHNASTEPKKPSK